MLGQSLGFFGWFECVQSSVLVDNLGLEAFEVQFFQIWAQVWPVSGQTGSKIGLYAWRGSIGFEVQFWWTNLGSSSEFAV